VSDGTDRTRRFASIATNADFWVYYMLLENGGVHRCS
jgi:hypothetical protein